MTKPLPFGNLAVMASRRSPPDGLDDFPTPPWATRALMEIVLPRIGYDRSHLFGSALEPACNRGIMAEVLGEYFDNVFASDVWDYGYRPAAGAIVEDYLSASYDFAADWIITNPPFNKALEFTLKALDEAREGVAMLGRLQWLESEERYDRLFSRRPPAAIATFVERVPMHQGRWDPNGGTMTAYAWFVWRLDVDSGETAHLWIPPGQRTLLTRADDAARFCEPSPAPLLDGLSAQP